MKSIIGVWLCGVIALGLIGCNVESGDAPEVVTYPLKVMVGGTVYHNLKKDRLSFAPDYGRDVAYTFQGVTDNDVIRITKGSGQYGIALYVRGVNVNNVVHIVEVTNDYIMVEKWVE